MELDPNRFDSATRALLEVGLHDEPRALKGFDGDAISGPATWLNRSADSAMALVGKLSLWSGNRQ